MKRPIKKLTIEQLAARIWMLPKDTEYNFSEKEDGSDYWGAKHIDLFECDYTFIGYYGQAPTLVISPESEHSYTEFEEAMKECFQQEFLWVFED